MPSDLSKHRLLLVHFATVHFSTAKKLPQNFYIANNRVLFNCKAFQKNQYPHKSDDSLTFRAKRGITEDMHSLLMFATDFRYWRSLPRSQNCRVIVYCILKINETLSNILPGLAWAAIRPASCSCIFSSSMGVVIIIWQNPARPPATICLVYERALWKSTINVLSSLFSLRQASYPSLALKWCLKKSLAASFMAFSGVIKTMFTAEPLYIPKYPSALYVLTKQSQLLKKTPAFCIWKK